MKLIKEFFIRQAQYNQTVRELNSLSNRDLNDLGIDRSDIRRIARDHRDALKRQ